jgi:H+-translocating NAD(P) transhydrogenase subunit alpha
MTGALLIGIYILVLSIFVGFELINKVAPTLHTAVLGGSSAITGITLLGALYAARGGQTELGNLLGAAAIALAAFTVVGGLFFTDRLLGGTKRQEGRG